jgi:hypothetical protein
MTSSKIIQRICELTDIVKKPAHFTKRHDQLFDEVSKVMMPLKSDDDDMDGAYLSLYQSAKRVNLESRLIVNDDFEPASWALIYAASAPGREKHSGKTDINHGIRDL